MKMVGLLHFMYYLVSWLLVNSAVGLLWTGFISSTVALDRLHCNWIALERLHQQYICSGQALSAVRLLWTGFISSTAALDRLHWQ